MPSASRQKTKRGRALKHLDLLERLRPILRLAVDPERMLRTAAALLASEIGHYCFVDIVDRKGLRRIEIAHADASRTPRLRVLCEDAVPNGTRIDRVIAQGSELTSRVTEASARLLLDLQSLPTERARSYMAATISVGGSPMAVVSMVVVNGRGRYDEGDLALLLGVSDWIGLGLENALRRGTTARSESFPRWTHGESHSTSKTERGRSRAAFQIRNGTPQGRKGQSTRYG